MYWSQSYSLPFAVIDGYVFLPLIGLLVFKRQLKPLRKMCSAIQKFKESLFWFLSSKYIFHRYDLHCALESYVERPVRAARIT